MRFLSRLVLFALIAVALVGGGFVLWFDHIARTGIERGGSYALGVPTTLESIRLQPLQGEIELSGLRVSNPDGYGRASFLVLSSGRARVHVKTVFEPVIEISRVEIEGVEVALEERRGQSNYGQILDNLGRLGGEADPAAPEPRRRVVIREMVIRNITAFTRLERSGQPLPELDVEIPEIRLTNLGEEGGGIAMAELSGILTQAVLRAVVKRGGNLPRELVADLGRRLARAQARRLLDDVGVQIGGAASRLGEAASQGIDAAAERLKRLLGGGEEEAK